MESRMEMRELCGVEDCRNRAKYERNGKRYCFYHFWEEKAKAGEKAKGKAKAGERKKTRVTIRVPSDVRPERERVADSEKHEEEPKPPMPSEEA